MTAYAHTRRTFLASLGALSAARALDPTVTWAAAHETANGDSETIPRGLAASDDFGFAPGLVYLQTGSLGPTPRSVIERTLAAWKELELNPAKYGYGAHEHAMDSVREKAAQFLGCSTVELVLTNSTTEGMNWIAQGLTWSPGDRVLTTDQEHPGGRSCWDHVARRYGVTLDIVTIPPGENSAEAILQQFAARITSRTRVLSFSHILSSTGLLMPVAQLSALARARGCLAVVDGAQAVGGIEVNVKALNCHAYATSGHKWLLAPKGTGLLYLSDELNKAIDPIALEGGRAAYSNSSGVTSVPSVLGLGATFDYINAIGPRNIEMHNLALRNRLYEALKGVPRLRVMSAPPGPLASPLLTFALPDTIKSIDFHDRLSAQYNIELKVVPANWLNGNRVSTHLFNTERDVDALVMALHTELG